MPIVEVPGMGEVEFPDTMSDDDIAAAIKRNLGPAQPAPTVGQKLRNTFDPAELASAAVRPAVKAITAIPGVFADGTMAAWNLATGQNNELPSIATNRLLDQYTRKPEGVLNKGAEFVSTAIAGGRIPSPQIGQQAPQNFTPPAQALRNQALATAQKEGYVVPPASNNPTVGNRLLEGISGKIKLQQEASIRNQATTDRLAARALGQNETAPLSQGALSTIRKEAADAGYAPIRAAGAIKADAKYLEDLAEITKAARGASRSFPGLKPQGQIDEIVETLGQKQFDAGDGLDAISYLRELSDDAYSSGNKSLGKAYKSASKAVEDMIERDLASRGDDAAGALKAFRDARQLIAKTYTAGKALAEDTGSSSARKYASELAKGKPLTGDQRTIAGFSTQFPKATQFVTESHPSISPLDAYGSTIAAGASGSAAPLMIPLTRVGIREYLLSQAGQARAIPKAFAPRTTLGPHALFPIAGQEMTGLFGQ